MSNTKIQPIDNLLYNNVVEKIMKTRNISYKIYPHQIVQQAEQLATDAIHHQIYKPGVAYVKGKNTDGYISDNYSDMLFKDNANKSMFGTLVLSDFYFKDMTIDGLSHSMLIDNKSVIDTCLIDCNQTKEIIKTKINGRSGTIKEYIGDSDYIINIKGIISGNNGHYPYDKVRLLKDFLTLNYQLEIVCPYLNEMFKIKNVVVENYDLGQTEGGFSYQTFSINLSSDDVDYTDKILKIK